MAKVFIAKIRIEIKDDFDDMPNLETAIRENIEYPALQPEYVEGRDIISWQQWRKR